MKYLIYRNNYTKKCLAIESLEILAGDIWCNNNRITSYSTEKDYDEKFIEFLFEYLLKVIKSNKIFIDFGEVLEVALKQYNKDDEEYE